MKDLKSTKNLALMLILMIIPLFATLSFASAQEEDEDDTIVVKNPNPILTQYMLPGFHLSYSSTVKDKKTGEEEYIIEHWNSITDEEWGNQITSGKNLMEIERILIKIMVYHFENQKDAVDFAKQLCYVRTDKDVERGPIRGSYTGQKIGDMSWRGLTAEEIKKYYGNTVPASRPSYHIYFIKAGTLVCLDVDAFARQIPASFAEDIAKKIESRIK